MMGASDATLTLRGLACAWIAAVFAFPSALILAASGQGFGAIVGGCEWIGVTLPLDRQVAALVNEPTLNFASRQLAAGYWLGGLLLPLAVALLAVGFLPRPRSFAAELTVVELAWIAAVVGCIWLPLLEPGGGQVGRWLHFRQWSRSLLWLGPLLGLAATVVPTLRLLALVRTRRPTPGRLGRLIAVVLFLGVPALAWVAAVSLAIRRIPLAATVLVAITVLLAALVAWIGYPRAPAHRLTGVRAASLVRLAVVAVLLSAAVVAAGWHRPGGRRGALLWAAPAAYTTVDRSLAPLVMPWVRSTTGPSVAHPRRP